MSSYEWLQKLYAAANLAQQQRMGMVADGPFTRVWFVYRRADIELIRDSEYARGTHIHCISSRA